MSRVEHIGDATLYLGDCRDVASEIVADAVISDPPYGIGYVHSGVHGGKIGATAPAAARGCEPIVGDKPIGHRWNGKQQSKCDREAGAQASFAGDNAPFDPAPFLRFDNVLLWGADHYRTRLPEGGRWLAWNKLGHLLEPWDSFSDVEFAWHSRGGGKPDLFADVERSHRGKTKRRYGCSRSPYPKAHRVDALVHPSGRHA